jgi:hypothetical protein
MMATGQTVVCALSEMSTWLIFQVAHIWKLSPGVSGCTLWCRVGARCVRWFGGRGRACFFSAALALSSGAVRAPVQSMRTDPQGVG